MFRHNLNLYIICVKVLQMWFVKNFSGMSLYVSHLKVCKYYLTAQFLVLLQYTINLHKSTIKHNIFFINRSSKNNSIYLKQKYKTCQHTLYFILLLNIFYICSTIKTFYYLIKAPWLIWIFKFINTKFSNITWALCSATLLCIQYKK